MKKKVVLLAYCIPWMFLVLYGDAVHGWGWQYVLIFLCMALLAGIGVDNAAALLTGNGLSLVTSLLLIHLAGFSQMNAYFKPFGAVGWTIALAVASFLAQWLVWKREWLILGLLTGVVGAFVAGAYWLQVSM